MSSAGVARAAAGLLHPQKNRGVPRLPVAAARRQQNFSAVLYHCKNECDELYSRRS